MKINDLKKSSSLNIHFHDQNVSDLQMYLPGILVLEGSIHNVKNDNELFCKISKFMSFPSYFGRNWDALADCLKDMEWAPSSGYVLVLNDAADAWSKNPYLWGIFVETWMGVAEFWKNFDVPFHLIFSMNQGALEPVNNSV